MTFTFGGVDVAAVHVGATAAEAVYLGDEKVWPIQSRGASFSDDIAAAADPKARLIIAMDGTTNTAPGGATLTIDGTHTPSSTPPPGHITQGVLNHANVRVWAPAGAGWNGPITTADQVLAGFFWWPGQAATPSTRNVQYWHFGGHIEGKMTLTPGQGVNIDGGAMISIPAAGWYGYVSRADPTDGKTFQLDVWDGVSWRTSTGTQSPNPQTVVTLYLTDYYNMDPQDPILTVATTLVGGNWGAERSPMSKFHPIIEAWYS